MDNIQSLLTCLCCAWGIALSAFLVFGIAYIFKRQQRTPRQPDRHPRAVSVSPQFQSSTEPDLASDAHKLSAPSTPTDIQCPNCGGYKVVDFREGDYFFTPINILLTLVTLGWWLLIRFSIAFLFPKREPFHEGEIVDFKCRLCGYQWTWKVGQPKPQVHVNPDLIRKGEQKLKEEDEWWETRR